MPQNSGSAPTQAVPENPEVLLTPREATAMLRILSQDKIDDFARKNTTLGTSDGPIQDESWASILGRATVSFSSTKTWSLTVDEKPLEYVVVLLPRSGWAFNVGPGGNFGVTGWKTGDKLPNGIKLEVQTQSGSDDGACWLKTTRSPTDLFGVWHVQLWKTQFLNARSAEYAVSGRPVAWEAAVEIHNAIDKRWEAFAAGRQDELIKKKCNNGPTSSMFLSCRRPVFVPNATSQDEGRASEFDDTYKLLSFLSNTDLRFNRVPEVLIYNAEKKTYHPMSFHNLNRLGTGLVMLATITPIAYSWGGKYDKKADMSWEYRLVTLTVMGRREDDALSSPSKHVLKRKIVDLGDSSGDETNSRGKRSGAGPSSSPIKST